ncbi:MAG: hypothetical protein ABI651_15415 [Verrucomicrobiota bacterium]
MRKLCGSLVVLLGMAASQAAELASVVDFKLIDVNPGSIRRNSPVSPRDYFLQVSGYYFGAAG